MILDRVTGIASSFPEVAESPHFHKTSFRIKKKIFATLDLQKQELVVKLSLIDQSVFCDMMKSEVQPVPGRWGKKGWTLISLEHMNEEALTDLLKTAYNEVAPDTLKQLLKNT